MKSIYAFLRGFGGSVQLSRNEIKPRPKSLVVLPTSESSQRNHVKSDRQTTLQYNEMQFSKPLTLLLVAAYADPDRHSSAYSQTEPLSGTGNTALGTGIDFISRNLQTHQNPRTLGENKKPEIYHDVKDRELPALTHTALKQKHAVHRENKNSRKGDPPTQRHQRHLRQLVQPVTVQRSVQCTGTRKIVQCKDNVPESVCKEDLIKSGVQVLSDMPKTEFFAICVDSEADAAIVAALTTVDGVEDDPPRTLSVVEGSFVKRRLQAFQQVTPYGIEMVKAPEFWSRYNGNQGSGIKVCVIDTGLLLSHEDIRDGDVSGSDGAGLLSPVSYAMKT